MSTIPSTKTLANFDWSVKVKVQPLAIFLQFSKAFSSLMAWTFHESGINPSFHFSTLYPRTRLSPSHNQLCRLVNLFVSVLFFYFGFTEFSVSIFAKKLLSSCSLHTFI